MKRRSFVALAGLLCSTWFIHAAEPAPLNITAGFNATLVSDLPAVTAPVAIEWDSRNRLWAALAPEGKPGSLVVLAGDGPNHSSRTARVFADKLPSPGGFVFLRDGVVIALPPQIAFLRDTDGDGKADAREMLFDGLGSGAVVSTLRWGMDGWIYASLDVGNASSVELRNREGRSFGKFGHGIVRFRPDASALEVVAATSNPVRGMDFSWEGELFFSRYGGAHLNHLVMSERFLAKGRLAGALCDKAISDHDQVNSLLSDARPDYVQVAPAGKFTTASGCTVYEGGAWPERYFGCAFVSEPAAHVVHEDILYRQENPTFEATRREVREFLLGTGFSPSQTRVGPDGSLHVVDTAASRIWRVQHKTPRHYDAPDFLKATSEELAHAFLHPNRWVRATAQRILVERGERSVVPALENLLTNRMMFARVHALWTLHALDALSETNLLAALKDEHLSVQNNALDVVADARVTPPVSVVNAVVRLLKDNTERTRLDALLTLTTCASDTNALGPVQRLYPDLRDAWSKSAVLGIARHAPTNFLRLALASDKTDSYRDISAALVADLAAARDTGSAAWLLAQLPKAGSGADKLKVAVLEAFNKLLPGFAPDWGTNVDAGLKALLKSENRTVRVAALPLAGHFEAQGKFTTPTAALRETLLADLSNEKLKEEDRVALLASLVAVESMRPEVFARLDTALAKGAPTAIQKAALTELARVPDRAAAEVLLKNFGKLGSEQRTVAIATIARRPEWSAALLDALAAKTVKPADLGVAGAWRMLTLDDAALATRARQVLEKLKEAPAKDRAAVAKKFTSSMRKNPGDARSGKEAYEKHCAACHRSGDKGRDIGPELTGAGLHGGAGLLARILDPNHDVESKFNPVLILTTQGEHYTGLIKTEGRETLTIKHIEGDTELRRSDIVSMRTTRHSLMPEGYESLGDKTLRDLVAYISSNTPKGFRALDLSRAFTADSRRGLFAEATAAPSLPFKQYGVVMVDNIPFNIVNPAATPGGKNVVVLRGGTGFAKQLPQKVQFNAGTRASKLYILGGVAGWGFPYGEPAQHSLPACKATLHYADGATEEVTWRNGEEFADYVQPFEVPGSRPAADLLTEGQVRWFSYIPKRAAEIKTITLESFDNALAPTFVALTAQVE
jgi:uncharacterized protein